jgi:TPR repeat protein
MTVAVGACASRPLVLTPAPPPPAACPLEGCDARRAKAIEAAAPRSACPAAGEAPCSGDSPAECTARALAAWAAASDDRSVACVARTLTDACNLGDARACAFAGRLWLDGRGVDADAARGVGMLTTACLAGEETACRVALDWLSGGDHAGDVDEASTLRGRLKLHLDCLTADREARVSTGGGESCAAVGEAYAGGRNGFPRDLARSAAAYERGCMLGQGSACNNLADAFEYGNGVPRDLAHAGALYDRACRLGQALGCANLGHLVENGEGTPRDVPRARALYRDACATGEVYACLHAAMSAVGSPANRAEAMRALGRWEKACAAGSAQACAFVGVLYEDGPDGEARDERKSMEAMVKACKLGNRLACEWVSGHS